MARGLELEGPGGRRLDVELSGPDDGAAVVFHTGTPEAGTLFEAWVADGAARDLRHVAYSRPGYAGSQRSEGRSVADCAADVAAIADALEIERFFTVGWSGGGPHALACAALLGERVIAAATIASVAPRDVDGLDWLAGMGQENLDEFAAADAGAEQLLAYLDGQARALAGATAGTLQAALGDLLSEVDRAVLTGEFAEYLVAAADEGLADGVWGWLDDDLAFNRDWGFDLGAVARPVTIWQGRHDRFVPFAHGQWLAAHVAGARPRLLEDHGHLSLLIGGYGAVLDDLLGD